MGGILSIALAPVIIIAGYLYYRDKYEKEPMNVLLLAMFFGALTTLPLVFIEDFLSQFGEGLPKIQKAAYDGFFIAAFNEELFKYLVFVIYIWRNKNFNEYFDGIIYAVFISLGFAAFENILYVAMEGLGVGFLRAFTAVPAHAIFGISMGYHFALAKFGNRNQTLHILLALIIPILLHGIYDFILMVEVEILLLAFILYLAGMWILGFKKMKAHSNASVFKPNEEQQS